MSSHTVKQWLHHPLTEAVARSVTGQAEPSREVAQPAAPAAESAQTVRAEPAQLAARGYFRLRATPAAASAQLGAKVSGRLSWPSIRRMVAWLPTLVNHLKDLRHSE